MSLLKLCFSYNKTYNEQPLHSTMSLLKLETVSLRKQSQGKLYIPLCRY